MIWHNTEAGEYPEVYGSYEHDSYPQIPCLVLLKSSKIYGIRFWNVTEECWDDEDREDYYCGKDEVSDWAYLDDITKLD